MLRNTINKILVCDSIFCFYSYSNISVYNDLSFESKQNRLIWFCYELIEFKNSTPEKTNLTKSSYTAK